MVCIGGEGEDRFAFSGQKTFVVVELKNVRAGQNTFGQISNSLVKEKFAKKKRVSKRISYRAGGRILNLRVLWE